jgi:hypothetical protein
MNLDRGRDADLAWCTISFAQAAIMHIRPHDQPRIIPIGTGWHSGLSSLAVRYEDKRLARQPISLGRNLGRRLVIL